MVQDDLLRLQVRFEAGALLAFESAIAFDGVQQDPERRTWLRLATALAKYLTAEYAIEASRAALELFGGNGYTSDYPLSRLLRDAQVLTVWEGPANIQALELLRLLAPRYGGLEQYQTRIAGIVGKLPASTDDLRLSLQSRLAADMEAAKTTLRDQSSSQRYARRLLHRMSQTLAFALLCEAAGEDLARGDQAQAHSARLYFEDLEPPAIGSENDASRQVVLELLNQAGRRLTTTA